nr:MAG TPA: hypothetical protein [Caudoviricetes sp.]
MALIDYYTLLYISIFQLRTSFLRNFFLFYSYISYNDLTTSIFNHPSECSIIPLKSNKHSF